MAAKYIIWTCGVKTWSATTAAIHRNQWNRRRAMARSANRNTAGVHVIANMRPSCPA